MNLNNLSISKKLWGAILVLLVAMLAIGGFMVQRVYAIESESMAAVNSMHNLTERSVQWKGMTETAVTRGMAAAISSDPAVSVLFKDSLEKDSKTIGDLRASIAKVANSDDDKAAMKEIAARGAALIAASKKASALGEEGKRDQVPAFVQAEYAPAAAAYIAAIDEFSKLQVRKGEQALAAAEGKRQTVMGLSALGALIVIALGMSVAALLVRSIRVPLQESIKVAGAIAEGDLTQRIATHRKDEFGSLMLRPAAHERIAGQGGG